MKKVSSIVAGLLALACSAALAQSGDFKVTLLGTGVPNPRPERFSQSTLVEAGSQKLVFDLGRGVTIRLWQLKVPMGRIDAHFITHFHSDHLVGLPDLWLTGWLSSIGLCSSGSRRWRAPGCWVVRNGMGRFMATTGSTT